MSIRIKLIIAYMIMITLSGFILVTSGFGMIGSFFSNMTSIVMKDKQLDEVVYEVVDLLADLKSTEQIEPALLLDKSYMEEVEKRISEFSSTLIVKYKDDFINVGQLDVSEDFFQKLLMKNPYYHTRGERIITHQEATYFYMEHDFTYQGDRITYYFIVDVTLFRDTHTTFVRGFLFVLIIILLIVILPLTYILSRDIIHPLKKLEEGTHNIQKGNLDFKLEAQSKNEIGRVINSFDRMRYELKKSLEQQIEYEENRKELISSISHDLKTPITSIKGYVEGIMDGVANSPEKLEKYLHVIYNKSEHMDRLIDDLFLFSKLDLNRLPFDMEDIQVSRFIEDCMDELKLEQGHGDIKIKMQNQVEEDTLVIIDSQKIRRVIFNIVQNAIKYMEKDDKILTISLTERQDTVSISIMDNGVGIKKEQLPFIFNKFYRVDESRNTKAGGTGLGLSIAKQIIEAHGGTIWARSQEGEGTTICFTLKKVMNGE